MNCILIRFSPQPLWIKRLRTADFSPNLRRQTGIIVRSGALRDLHDLALCISFGANAVLPYALYAVSLGTAPRGSKTELTSDHVETRLNNTLKAIHVGLQKITSTIGCHELRGYGHSFSSIGLSKNLASILGTPNYFGSTGRGLTWTSHCIVMLKNAHKNSVAKFAHDSKIQIASIRKMWKKAEAVAHGEMSLEEYTETLWNGFRGKNTGFPPSHHDLTGK